MLIGGRYRVGTGRLLIGNFPSGNKPMGGQSDGQTSDWALTGHEDGSSQAASRAAALLHGRNRSPAYQVLLLSVDKGSSSQPCHRTLNVSSPVPITGRRQGVLHGRVVGRFNMRRVNRRCPCTMRMIVTTSSASLYS